MLCWTTQDGWVIVESYDKTWSTGGVNGKPLQYSWQENHEQYEKAKRYDPERLAPGQKMSDMPLGLSRGQLVISPQRMKPLVQRGNDSVVDVTGW